MKQKKGFTLVELLATIVILGIITGISYPALTAYQRSNEKRKYEKYGESLINAAKLYVDAYEDDLFSINDETKDVTIFYSQLEDKKLIKDINISNLTCNSEETYVEVHKENNKFTYTFHLGCGIKQSEDALTGQRITIMYP